MLGLMWLDAASWEARISHAFGYTYGLVYGALRGQEPAQPATPLPANTENPTGRPLDAEQWRAGVDRATSQLGDAAVKNQLYLLIAEQGPEEVLRQVWEKAVHDNDHQFRAWRLTWPEPGRG